MAVFLGANWEMLSTHSRLSKDELYLQIPLGIVQRNAMCLRNSTLMIMSDFGTANLSDFTRGIEADCKRLCLLPTNVFAFAPVNACVLATLPWELQCECVENVDISPFESLLPLQPTVQLPEYDHLASRLQAKSVDDPFTQSASAVSPPRFMIHHNLKYLSFRLTSVEDIAASGIEALVSECIAACQVLL